MAEQCAYMDQVRDVSPETDGCEECLETEHALMQFAEPGEGWPWCYIDQTYLRS
jgi:hypothetical protein